MLLRKALCPDVPGDQMQLPPCVVQVVRAPIQLLLKTNDFGLRGGEVKLRAVGGREHRVAGDLMQTFLEGWPIDSGELSPKRRSFCFKRCERVLCA